MTDAQSIGSTTTRYAILGQLALRDWSAYELTRSMRRTLRWFWPRAESVIYAEAKRLEQAGLATSTQQAGSGARSARTTTVYAITAEGRAALASWLAAPPTTFAMHLEPLLRLHLARFGTRADLLSTIAWLRAQTDEVMAVGDIVAAEFIAGEHVLQEEAHIRALLLDALTTQAQALRDWADRASSEVERWPSVNGDARATKRALKAMKDYRARRLRTAEG